MSATPIRDLILTLGAALEDHLEDCIDLDLNDPGESAHFWEMCEEVTLQIIASQPGDPS